MLTQPRLKIETHDPRLLVAAPWNPTRSDPEDEKRLDAALSRHAFFRPIICRELPDGTLQILGGHQRTNAAIRLGHTEIPVVNLGTVDEGRAREITLIDNGRYGRDDAGALADVIAEIGGKAADLALFLPFDIAELEAITSSSSINLDDLGLSEENAPEVEKPPRQAKTHEVMRFKVSIDDADRVRQALKTIIVDQNFTEADDLTNAGDALIWLIGDWMKASP